VWQELAGSVDTILHNGALVNHAFTYEQLFEPNVLGSVEVSASCQVHTNTLSNGNIHATTPPMHLAYCRPHSQQSVMHGSSVSVHVQMSISWRI
jgi:hypothetical protein